MTVRKKPSPRLGFMLRKNTSPHSGMIVRKKPSTASSDKLNVRHTLESLAKLRLLTLKALANSSPGLRFGNPGAQRIPVLRRNSEGVASRVAYKNRRNSFRVATNLFRLLDPGFQSKPWAGISQRFQRKGKSYVLVNLVLLTTLSRRVLQEALKLVL